jgi:hypothetical protein
MKKIFHTLILLLNSFSVFSQNENSTKQLEELISTSVIKVVTLLENEISNNPAVILNSKNEPSLNKFMFLTSKIILEEQKEVLDMFAKEVLTKEEYKHFNELSIEIKLDTKLPLSTAENRIVYDNKFIINCFVRQSIQKKINSYDLLYYNASSQFENNLFPDYLDIENLDINLMLKSGIMFLANGINTMLTNFFFIMHEFYHLHYEINKKELFSAISELQADMFAFDKLKLLIENMDDDDDVVVFVDDEILNQTFGEMISSNEEFKCKKNKIIGDSITMGSYLAPLIGLSFIDLLGKWHINQWTTEPDLLNIDLARYKQFVELALSNYKCEQDNDNVSCCRFLQLINNEEYLFFFQNLTKSNSVLFRNAEPVKENIISLMPQNPTFVCFSIGTHYMTIKNYDKAIKFFLLANSFDTTEMSVLCNMLCNDVYRLYFKDIEQANHYLSIAKQLNEKTPALSDEIINRNYTGVVINE